LFGKVGDVSEQHNFPLAFGKCFEGAMQVDAIRGDRVGRPR
jgi:hypothetical protein